MSIEVTSLPDAQPRPRHVAIGTFDGVHLGHQAVIDDADTVLTFDPHPLEVLHPAALPKLIMPFAVKRDVIEGLGVQELVVIPFDREFATVTAEDFIERILIERLGAERVSVGENFRFGAKAQGDPEMLAAPLGVRDPGGAAGRGRRRDRVLDPDPGAGRGRRHGGRPPLPRRPVHGRGDGRRGRPARPRAGLPDRQHRPRRLASRSPATASTRPSPTASRPPSTSASARPSRPGAAC